MDTRSLSYFTVVAEEKNIGRAAVRLHISQPALTRQIQSLEDDMGVALFIRTISGVELTSAGNVLLEHARHIKCEFEHARIETLNAAPQQPQRLNIGVYGTAMLNIIPQIIERFSVAHPAVELVLHNARKDEQIESLRQGLIQIAFDRFVSEEPDMILELVCREPVYVVLHNNHPLAGHRCVDPRDLRDEPFIGGHQNTANTESMMSILARCGWTPRVVQRVDDSLAAIALVGCGFGVTVAPPSMQSLRFPNVVMHPLLSASELSFDLYCMYLKGEKSRTLEALINVVRAFSAEHSMPQYIGKD